MGHIMVEVGQGQQNEVQGTKEAAAIITSHNFWCSYGSVLYLVDLMLQ